MSNFNCCLTCVCVGSGCKLACVRQIHDIGTKCGATGSNTTGEIINDNNGNSTQQNQQKFKKFKRQLEVVSNAADRFPEDLDDYVEPNPYKNQPAAFVPSKVPARRFPPYMKISIREHHITPHMRKVNLMSKFHTLPELKEIEKYLDIEI